MTMSVVTQIAITGAVYVKVGRMLTVIVTAKTGLYQYNMQRVGGVGIRDF
jgi:hypothetical protein